MISKNLNPVWDQKFEFIVQDYLDEMLYLEVFDKDLVMDEKMGDFSLPLKHFGLGKSHDMIVDLENVESGQLELSLLILPEGGAVAGSLQIKIFQAFAMNWNMSYFIQMECGISKASTRVEHQKGLLKKLQQIKIN